MRADMDKVIVERPRYGSRLRSWKKGYRKHLQATDPTELPLHEPLIGRWRGMNKSLNEHLGPMRRFLRAQVGRPWNKIHQELCEHVSFDNAVQKHVLVHIGQYVHRLVVYDGEQVRTREGWGIDRALTPGDMFVCPRTGLLRTVPPCRKQPDVTRQILDPATMLLFRDGAWWKVRVRPRPAVLEGVWDVWLNQLAEAIPPSRCKQEYGSLVVATSARPLTAAERKSRRRCGQKFRRTKPGRRVPCPG